MPLISALALFSASLPPQEGPPAAPLKPAGSWVVDYADNACNVARVFGSGDRRLTFVLVLMPGRDTNQIVIQRAYDGKERIRQGDLVITTTPGAPPITTYATSGSVKAGTRLLHATVGAEDLLRMEQAKSLTLAHRGETIRLATNGMKAPLAAAVTCEDDLLRRWGADPAEFRKIAVRAKATQSPAKWVTNDDYPPESVVMDESGSVGVRLDIAADGKLTACTVISSSTFARLDEATCTMVRRHARYEPARLADGKAVASAAFLRFRWQIQN